LALRGYTDSNGRINFDVPSGTRYQASVSGPGIESRSTTFDIPPTQRFLHEEIEVELNTGGTATKGPGGMVSASNLRVPEKAGHEFAKGMKEMSAHNWSKARKHLEKAIKDYPQFDWAYNNLGVACMQENDAKDARAAFEKAVAINDKNTDAVKNLARLELADNDFAGAKAVLLKLGQEPRDPEALTMLSYTQLRTWEFNAALDNALKVPHEGPERFPVVHLIAARVYEIRGNRSAAEAQYKQYLNVAPDGPEARVAKEGIQRVEAPHP
jgi:Tfp pilus assembly protein PilF